MLHRRSVSACIFVAVVVVACSYSDFDLNNVFHLISSMV